MNEQAKRAALEVLTNAPDYHLHAREMSAAATDAGANIHEVRAALAKRSEYPRSLSSDEEYALRYVIETSGSDDSEQLLGQVPSAKVVGYCGCGCATIDLVVSDPAAPIAKKPSDQIGDVVIVDDQDEVWGGAMIFVAEGKLATLEVYSYVGEQVSPMPDRDHLRFEPPSIVRP